MARKTFPENFVEEAKTFNRTSESDPEKLSSADRQKYNLIAQQKDMETEKIKADNERYREQRIKKELDRMLRTPEPVMNGPTPPYIGGRRADQPQGVARENLSPEEMRHVRETAERNVREAEHNHLKKVETTFTQAQKELLDRALGPDRYPVHER